MVNQELESWVEERLAEGYDPAQIEQRLREEGWDEQSIEEAERIAQEKIQSRQNKQQPIEDKGFQQNDQQQEKIGTEGLDQAGQNHSEEKNQQGEPQPGQRFGEAPEDGYNQMKTDSSNKAELEKENNFQDGKGQQNSNTPDKSVGSNSENIEYASIGQRILAYIADGFITSLLMGVLFGIGFMALMAGMGASMEAAVSQSSQGGGDLISLVGFGIIGLAFLSMPLYYIVLPARNGKTLGKKILGIKIVREDGSPIGLKESAIRYVLLMIDSLPFLFILGFYYMKNSNQNQRLGDKVAGTVVIQE